MYGYMLFIQYRGWRELNCPARDETDMKDDVILAHKHCSLHRSEIEASNICGCFYCFAIFSPSEIQDWIDDGHTAMCPHCSIDTVIGSASGYPIEKGFLQQMHDHYF